MTPRPQGRPVLPTPNHPEYPSAHCTITSAIGEVIARFMGTDAINIDLVGTRTSAPRATSRLSRISVQRSRTPAAGPVSTTGSRRSPAVQLGKEVADYDLDHAFNAGG